MTESEPDVAAHLDDVTRAVVTDTLKRYRGVAASVALVLLVIAIAPTRSPAIAPFSGFAAVRTPEQVTSTTADEATDAAPTSVPDPTSPVIAPPRVLDGTTPTIDGVGAGAATTTTVRSSPTTTSTTTPSTTTTTAPPGEFPDCLFDGTFCR